MARQSQPGRSVKAPKLLNLMASFIAATTSGTIQAIAAPIGLLQPDIQAHAEPHPFALFSVFVGWHLGPQHNDPQRSITTTRQRGIPEGDAQGAVGSRGMQTLESSSIKVGTKA